MAFKEREIRTIDPVENLKKAGLLEIWPRVPFPRAGNWLIDLEGKNVNAMLTQREGKIYLEIMPKEESEKPILIICTSSYLPSQPAFYLVHPEKRPLNWYPHEEIVSAEIILNLPPEIKSIDIICLPFPFEPISPAKHTTSGETPQTLILVS